MRRQRHILLFMDIQFLGAARQVTGSCFLLRVAGRKILVECGLFQGPRQEEIKNRQPFPFDPASIDAVILTHAHLDHSGRLPLLIKAGFKGPVYAHRATRDLCRILLKDSGYLNEKQAEWENRKRQRKGLAEIEPLYGVHDAAVSLRRFHVLDYGVERELFPGVRLRLQDAGHILGSAILELWLHENGQQRKLVFSGDLGHQGAPILHDPASISEADLVILESTYGGRLHRPWGDTWEELGEVFRVCHQSKGNVLIPAFAVGRTQEMLYAFVKNYQAWDMGQWNIFLDSPLAIEATEIYARHQDLFDRESLRLDKENGTLFDLPNLRFTKTTLQSMAVNRISSGAVVIAGSGMCTGGRITHHLKHNLWRKNCHVIIVGFQAYGTPGRALVDGAEEITLWGESIRVAATVHTIGGFSAHADSDGLVNWYRHIENSPPVVLVHGEAMSMTGLQDRLQVECQARVMIPDEGGRIDLNKLAYQGKRQNGAQT